MLITNANIITFQQPNQILRDYAILIKKGKIEKIGKNKELVETFPHEEQLNVKSQYVLPGNLCTHTHFYSAFSRGLSIPGDAPSIFPEILSKLWWKLDKSLDLEAVYLSALVSLIDAIKHGTTTLVDHHASPNAINTSLDHIARAVQESGLRAVLCYEVSERDGEKRTAEGIEENLRFLDLIKTNHAFNNHITGMFGLHASLTLSDSTLDRCRSKVSKNTGFHIHVAEHYVDEYDSLKKTGKRVIERLNEHGILGDKTIAAHCVHVDSNEAFILKQTNTWVTHQPRSNMNNAVGVASVESMLHAGIKVGMGNDGFSNAMWDEWRTTYLVHKLWNLDPRRMGADKIIEMAVYNNAELINHLFENIKVGVISEGAQADLIIVDYDPITILTPGNLPWHIIFGFRDGMVKTTIVDGKILMLDGELKTLDEDKITYEAHKISKIVWEKFNQQF
jgi:putative selenium metabolism protein SsnA